MDCSDTAHGSCPGSCLTSRRKKYDRTIDQMVQAARSGKQNIAEASVASATSKEKE